MQEMLDGDIELFNLPVLRGDGRKGRTWENSNGRRD